MVLQLKPSELGQLSKALLSAFPNRGDLEQLLYFHLGVSLNQIVASGPYSNEVANLVIWAAAQGKIEQLLTEARAENSGNPLLRQFADDICRTYHVACSEEPSRPSQPVAHTSNTPITTPLQVKRRLISTLLTIPIVQTYQGRSTLLNGLPGALNRSQDNTSLDLDLMISQLDLLGQLTTGEWPLLLFIDNALPFVQGFSIEQELRKIQKELEEQYMK